MVRDVFCFLKKIIMETQGFNGDQIKKNENFEFKISMGNLHPFQVIKIKEKGFIALIYGCTAYIAFNHMPWQNTPKYWNIIFPYLKGKEFYARIYKYQKEPFSIYLDGNVPQFSETVFDLNTKYLCIVVHKIETGVLVDAGFDAGWLEGDVKGYVNKSQFENLEAFENAKEGDILELYFYRVNKYGQFLFGQKNEEVDFVKVETEKYLGKTLSIKVIIGENGKIEYQSGNEYSVQLRLNAHLYPDKRYIKKAFRSLITDDIINCEVIKVNVTKKILVIKWNSEEEMGAAILRGKVRKIQIAKEKMNEQAPIVEVEGLSKYNDALDVAKLEERSTYVKEIKSLMSLGARLDEKTSDKLSLIGKMVHVEVVKGEDRLGNETIKYLVEAKFPGKLLISNDNYKITNEEKKKIECNIQHGEILECQVIDINKNVIHVNWKINIEDLKRFLGYI